MKGEAPMTPADLDRMERDSINARGTPRHDRLAYWATRHAPALIATIRRQQEALEMAEALDWYALQVENCRKVTSEGEEARKALDRDGGQRARAALSLAQLRAVKADGGA